MRCRCEEPWVKGLRMDCLFCRRVVLFIHDAADGQGLWICTGLPVSSLCVGVFSLSE